MKGVISQALGGRHQRPSLSLPLVVGSHPAPRIPLDVKLVHPNWRRLRIGETRTGTASTEQIRPKALRRGFSGLRHRYGRLEGKL